MSPTIPKQLNRDDDFLDNMNQRISHLMAPEQASPRTSMPSVSMAGSICSTTVGSKNTVVAENDVEQRARKPLLPQNPFFVQMRAFSSQGHLAHMVIVEEEIWALYSFVMKWILDKFENGQLRPLRVEDLISGQVIVAGKGADGKCLMRAMVMGTGYDDAGKVVVKLRDMDEVRDLVLEPNHIYEMPPEGLDVPFRALEVEIDKMQLFASTDISSESFNEADMPEFTVFKAIVVQSSRKKSDNSCTLQLWTPKRKNLGEILLDQLDSLYSVPIPLPDRLLTVQISHYAVTGEIFYQVPVLQRKVLEIIQQFDTIVRRELPIIKAIEPNYSNVALIKERLQLTGHVFATQYSEDSLFYRATLIEWTDMDKVRVHFIDYGNDDDNVSIEDIVLLDGFDDALSKIPPMSRMLKLENVEYLDPVKMESLLVDYANFKIRGTNTDQGLVGEMFVNTTAAEGRETLERLQDVLRAM